MLSPGMVYYVIQGTYEYADHGFSVISPAAKKHNFYTPREPVRALNMYERCSPFYHSYVKSGLSDTCMQK